MRMSTVSLWRRTAAGAPACGIALLLLACHGCGEDEETPRLRAELDAATSRRDHAGRQLGEAKRRAARLGKRAGSIDELIRTIGEQIAAKKKEKTAAEKEIEGLTTELKAATALLYKVSRREERIALGARPILGKVTQLHPDDGAVSLDVGNRHGVGVGDPFFVARGPQYVGKVVVTEVEIERCRAAPRTEAMKGEIKVGDAVSSRLAMDAAEGSKP